MELQADQQLRASLARKIEAWRSSNSAAAGGARALIAAAKREADVALVSAMKRAFTKSNPADPNAIHAILLKPVADHCNLRCRYCYEGIGTERFQFGRLSPQVLRKTITEGCEQAPRNRIQFLWHGGEPLLAGRALFQVGVDQQRVEQDQSGIEISNSVQTNGTLLDTAWLKFFRDAGFAIGISLDGPRDIHDNERVDAKGQGTYDTVVDAIRRIQDRQLAFGVIAVITPRHVPHAARVVRHFHDLGVRNLDMHPAVGFPQKDASAASTDLCPDGFAQFMTDAFDEWLAIGDPQFRINIFSDFLRGWFGARPAPAISMDPAGPSSRWSRTVQSYPAPAHLIVS